MEEPHSLKAATSSEVAASSAMPSRAGAPSGTRRSVSTVTAASGSPPAIPLAVVTIPVKRGMVTLVVLAQDEVITEVAAGQGGDCSKADAVWCVAAQPGGRNLFVKAKSGADAPNNLAVVTDRRTHALRFVVLADADRQQPVYRLTVKAPAQPKSSTGLSAKDLAALAALSAR